jgi:hypothetical protein
MSNKLSPVTKMGDSFQEIQISETAQSIYRFERFLDDQFIWITSCSETPEHLVDTSTKYANVFHTDRVAERVLFILDPGEYRAIGLEGEMFTVQLNRRVYTGKDLNDWYEDTSETPFSVFIDVGAGQSAYERIHQEFAASEFVAFNATKPIGNERITTTKKPGIVKEVPQSELEELLKDLKFEGAYELAKAADVSITKEMFAMRFIMGFLYTNNQPWIWNLCRSDVFEVLRVINNNSRVYYEKFRGGDETACCFRQIPEANGFYILNTPYFVGRIGFVPNEPECPIWQGNENVELEELMSKAHRLEEFLAR